LLYTGFEAAPLLFVSGLVAAVLSYHRNIFGWCGIPGVAALYGWYLAAALTPRSRWRNDPEMSTLRDVRRYVIAFLGAEFFSAITGKLTLLGDHLIQPADALKTIAEWWASDAIAILTFTPMLLVFVVPRVDRWFKFPPNHLAASQHRWPSRSEIIEMGAQFGSGVLAIWIVFGLTSAIPYQPLYLLFIPLIWVSVRHGLPGAALSVFAINVGLTLAAWITQAPRGSMPRLQFAMIGLGLAGLCLGAIVSEGKRSEDQLRRRGTICKKHSEWLAWAAGLLTSRPARSRGPRNFTDLFGFDPAFPVPLLAEQERMLSPESWKRLNDEFEETLRTGISV